MTEQRDIEEIYKSLLATVNDLLPTHDALAIAACMMAQALSIYRTSLDEEDFNRIVDNISEKRSQVRIFSSQDTLH